MNADAFHAWADLSPEPLFLASGEGVLLAANPAAAELLDPSAVCGRPLAALVEEEPERVQQFLRAASQSRQWVFANVTLPNRKGQRQVLRCEGAVLAPDADSVERRLALRMTPRESAIRHFAALNLKIQELASEIERRKQVELELLVERRRLEESRRRLNLALEAGRMGVWEWDLSTNQVVWSPEIERLHGIGPGEFPGTFEAYQRDMHPDDLPRVLASFQAALAGRGEHHLEYRIVWPDGAIHWIEARGRVIHDGDRPARMIGVCQGIDDRKRLELAANFLAEASRSLATLVDYQSTLQKVARLAVPIFADWCMVHLVGEDGRLRQLASAHADPAKAEIAEDLARRDPVDPSAPLGISRVFRTGRSEMAAEIRPAMLEALVPNPGQLDVLRRLQVRSYLCVPLAVRGRPLGTMTFIAAESGRRYDATDLAVAEDLADRAAIAIDNARLYAELRQADRRKDDFLAMLAHELRNPLAPLRTGLDLLAIDGQDCETVAVMQQQVEHLVRLVDDLLDVSRIMRGKVRLRKEAVDLQTVIDQAVRAAAPLIESQRHALEVRLPEEPLVLHGDRVRLAQVVTNLLNNAAKYTEPGGRIELVARREETGLVLVVRDNGIGIGKDLLPRVFDLFTQADRSLERSQGGLGIGLTLVRSLVELHGGAITAASDGEGKGSEFTVRLPPARGKAGAAKPGREPPREILPRRILVVEDNHGTAKMLGRLLGKLGSREVQLAYDGRQAIEVARQSRPEMILLDIGLPRMNGYEVARALRQDPAFDATALVALTGYGMEEDRRRSLEAGFDRHLVKPPSLDGLREILSDPELARRIDGVLTP